MRRHALAHRLDHRAKILLAGDLDIRQRLGGGVEIQIEIVGWLGDAEGHDFEGAAMSQRVQRDPELAPACGGVAEIDEDDGGLLFAQGIEEFHWSARRAHVIPGDAHL